MASVCRQSGGRRMVQVIVAGKRKCIRLGVISQRAAEGVATHVQHLASAKASGQTAPPSTVTWLGEIDDTLYAKLAKVGLVESKEPTAKLQEFTDAYITGRKDIGPLTVRNMRRAQARLVGFYGADRPMGSITEADADALYQSMVGKNYAPATIGRDIKRARQFYAAAMRQKLVQSNPFQTVKAPTQANRERDFEVTRAMIQQVLDACPDAEWRCIFALSRYGGLRCPSETLDLRWVDVDWGRNRVRIRKHKTAARIIPLFRELRPYLEEAFDAAAPGAEYVISRYRDSNMNLRTQAERILDRAGVVPWPKLFHNCRATRQSELVREFPISDVCYWIGNSVVVAAKHYLQRPNDAAYERAIGAPQSAAKSAAVHAA